VSDTTDVTPAEDIVYVLRVADAGWPEHCTDWTSQALAFACWNGLLAGTEEVTVTDEGRKFLNTVGKLYPAGPR
jgi:hypothetical protein